MAIFGSKKNKKEVSVVKTKVKAIPDVSSEKSDYLSSVRFIIRPRITEKATFQAETQGVYVFEVTDHASKRDISQAIQSLYKVTPTKVRMARNPSKRIFMKGKWGRTSGVKKAYVYLVKGEKIEIV